MRLCKFCGREHPVSEAAAAENPFCSACLHERMSGCIACDYEQKIGEPAPRGEIHECSVHLQERLDARPSEVNRFVDFMRRMARATDAGVSVEEASAAIYPDVYDPEQ